MLTGDAALARRRRHGHQVPRHGRGRRRAYEEWADAHNELQKLNDYGAELAFGYAELEEPREVRRFSALAEMAGSRDAA